MANQLVLEFSWIIKQKVLTEIKLWKFIISIKEIGKKNKQISSTVNIKFL